MRVVELKTKDEDGNINYFEKITIDNKLGIREAFSKRDKKKQISLLSKRVRNLIDKEELEGLCLFRFYENITIEGLDAKNLSVGESLQIGETVQKITSIGKRCFDECKIIQSGERCGLFKNVIFTRIIKGGTVKMDDNVSSLDK